MTNTERTTAVETITTSAKMTTMATTNNFSTGAASFRMSQSQTAADTSFSYSDSPLTQLPNIDFNFDDLRKRMSEFTTKFDAFIETGRKRVLEERNEFRARMGEINGEQNLFYTKQTDTDTVAENKRSTETQMSTLKSALSSHNHIIAREQVEKNEMHAQIAKLESHQANQTANRDRLKTSIAHTQRQIDAKLQAQREYADKIEAQSQLNGPELNFWETYLGCRIEGAGDDCLVKIVYAFPPVRGSKEEREASFELRVPDTGIGGYEVVHSQPKLDATKVNRVVERLNESRDLATLLKGMRMLFADEMR